MVPVRLGVYFRKILANLVSTGQGLITCLREAGASFRHRQVGKWARRVRWRFCGDFGEARNARTRQRLAGPSRSLKKSEPPLLPLRQAQREEELFQEPGLAPSLSKGGIEYGRGVFRQPASRGRSR